ncbi:MULTISPECIES: sugar phosphate isomerase/epimerase and 4-hydroxyphenylpyruvate domain-containing protein [unclassified Mesorhizobium]|uniref:bifunctional sugar phosphate isomerase/epimerase/4-hydroxyphenylpyruvate dioxygenase family protein n=1 Tax=unclassified Mesorhizobium TaxID=325217 RepID=UPI000FCA03EB|nr:MULTISPECIES: sugar phosphate isomerase/epimerase and 4-hydroxyphenylpyruvate domain-containing protein [unclassified Mesorhizobium]RUY03678.1 sugar phosphate isomerase/epimerase and 4-hydroxyphenylpyruvate domain-containing protein [Mesorhizobium sp. M2A.F.Ca.ET.040.01.1.1]RWA88952.1 MAG: sugar phosphate isomerase/epimerase and 4-hydroxyphenylpyruvate domain-containing protein [Mesorhizobium sp.]RWF36876.1 MAG: sugar phosphate isomerase/epimerase and 4-hydroxyphenylpyruvate domain-containing
MKTSIATVSISGDLREKLAAIAAAGFDGAEIFENDFLAFDGTPAEVGRMVRDHGLEITVFQPFRDFEGLPEPQRQHAFDRAERKFDLMRELGTDLMLVCSNVSPMALGGIDRAAADFRELGERAARRGLRVGYEALAWGRHINDHRDAWEIVRRADHPSIGLILDSFHTLARKTDVGTIRAIPGDRIFIVQLADAPLIDMDLLYWSRHFRNMPGEGDLPVIDFTRAVAATGYDGPLSLEIFNDQFRGGSPKSIAMDGRRSLIYLMDQVRRAEPGIAIDPPEMPDRIGVSGIEFIEFAANEQEGEELAALLSTMGFSLSARHKNRDVTVWRQGGHRGVNIVINTGHDGFAHSSYVVHGTNAYAMGLRVADAAATVARARALGAETFSEQRGPGEFSIPAIRGVGGGVIYFVDDTLAKVWDVEFDPLPQTGDTGCGLVGIDHAAQTMNYEEMLTWLLFYTSIFRTRKLPVVDVVDPSGLVRSQVVEGSDGGLRLTLNGAESRKTLAGRFIADSFGSGIQHIAFACDDIFATAGRLKPLGFHALEISANYYDDLEARLGLDPDLTNRLRAGNILYDRDETGEYFQLYSQNYGEGLFFEVVERRKGYKGYGAVNAPFRIAALKRLLPPSGMPR